MCIDPFAIHQYTSHSEIAIKSRLGILLLKMFSIFASTKPYQSMNVEALRDYCLSLGDVTEKMPFQQFKAAQSICAFYVAGHIFCYFDIDQFDACTIKCDTTRIDCLKENYESIGDPYNMNRKYWIRIYFRGDVDDTMLRSLIADSYEIVKQQHRKKSLSVSQPLPTT